MFFSSNITFFSLLTHIENYFADFNYYVFSQIHTSSVFVRIHHDIHVYTCVVVHVLNVNATLNFSISCFRVSGESEECAVKMPEPTESKLLNLNTHGSLHMRLPVAKFSLKPVDKISTVLCSCESLHARWKQDRRASLRSALRSCELLEQ